MYVVYDPPGDDSWQSLTISISNGNTIGIKVHLQCGLFLNFDSKESTAVSISETYKSNEDNIHTADAGDLIVGLIIYAELTIKGYTRFTPTGIYSKITSVNYKDHSIITKIPIYRYKLPRTSTWTYVELNSSTKIKMYYNADDIPNHRNNDGYKIGIKHTSPPDVTPAIRRYEKTFKNGFSLSVGIDFEREFHGVKSQFVISIYSESSTEITFTSNWQVHDRNSSITYQAYTDTDKNSQPNEYNIWNFAVWFKT